MMIRGGDPNNMRFGDTLSEDQFSGISFSILFQIRRSELTGKEKKHQ